MTNLNWDETSVGSADERHACPTCGLDGNLNLFPKSGDKPKLDHEPVLAQLRSGYVPSDAEKAFISSTIQDHQAELGGMNKDIDRLKLILEQLETRRCDVETEITYQAGLLAPIRRLPDELLGEIMVFCSHGRADVCSPYSDVWQMERVCKRWQGVAISLQSVWSSIDVFLGSLTPYNAVPMAVVTRLVDLCLQRSQDRSLSIKFMEIGSPDHFEDILNLLSRCSHRWEDISFSLSMVHEPPVLENGLPRLRSLGLSGMYKGPSTFESFKYAQQLSRLRLFSVPKPVRTLILPWSQLTYFKAVLCEFRTGEFMDMMHRMTNLVKFISRWNKGLTRNIPNAIKPIYLRSLSCLELEASPTEVCTVLQPLTVPALSTLYIMTQQIQNANVSLYLAVANSVASVIRRSRCSLTSLCLFSIDSISVCRILEETPTLTTLELGYIRDIEVILAKLSPPDILAPNLETLSLTYIYNQGTQTLWPLIDMVRARNDQNNPLARGQLRELNLTLKEEKGVEEVSRLLQPLGIETGISIVIHALAA